MHFPEMVTNGYKLLTNTVFVFSLSYFLIILINMIKITLCDLTKAF